MANKGHKFKKGNPGGPGRPRKDPDIAVATKITKTEAERILNLYMRMDCEELEAKLADKKTPMIEMMVGRVVLMAVKNGDQTRLDFLLNRLIGKVKDNVEVSVVKPTFVRRFEGDEVIELGAEEVKQIDS